jgi:hypothetical protein
MLPVWLTGGGCNSVNSGDANSLRCCWARPRRRARGSPSGYGVSAYSSTLTDAGCPQDMRWAVLGHEEKTVAAGYGEGFPVRLLKQWIDRMDFDQLATTSQSGGGISLGNAVGLACGAADEMQRQAVVSSARRARY